MQQGGKALHGEAHRDQNNRKIKVLLTLLGGITLFACFLIAISLVWRGATRMHNPNEAASQLITIAITVVFGALILFVCGMKLTPRLYYRRYLRESYQGLSREVSGTVKSISTECTFREGLYFYPCILSVGNLDDPEDDRLLYWDAQLGKPPFSENNRVRFVAHGNDIIGFDPAG